MTFASFMGSLWHLDASLLNVEFFLKFSRVIHSLEFNCLFSLKKMIVRSATLWLSSFLTFSYGSFIRFLFFYIYVIIYGGCDWGNLLCVCLVWNRILCPFFICVVSVSILLRGMCSIFSLCCFYFCRFEPGLPSN
jgi:hypothetical protein